ncbi:hypothetical protein A2774_01270 [Candidatus Roizmanbacteria bacterium RIFCSPHIGHO2_01_FULL_39_12c]|uniref:Type II secretion system protein GspF domain-containing protein n=1 Tax=Candidatus Roizmanbacteria bacterium RIFCSPHIGHO2_01_FULL_39_12c TaxID=1802031 RepID=A0A1F7GDJ9_9BACT|nr:MAG: hypothetical protein A2774_01270 [Candidatus Roizmanbacteria bacterium RIFCSPHIGHO2_01_FULL_39_12c]OGK47504.1 MAG: hypothetical protein A2963_01275 [Candidatus Roizmanbacteria bacterium RIFCSPLOWO2_01_FULL_40_13]
MQFKYKAIKNGKTVVEKIQADSQEAVLRYLKTNNYFPIGIWKSDISSISAISLFRRVGFSDIVDFTRQLAIMLDAGLTLIDALEILKKQVSKSSFLEVLENLDKEIKSGRNFSSSLALYPQYFSSLYVSLVKSGEATGKLSDILMKLSQNLEKERIFKGKLKASLVYPAFIILGMFVVAFIMMTFVVPKLLDLYKDFDAELPFSTKILIFISTILSKYWIFIVLIMGVAGLILYRYFKSGYGKLRLDTFLLRLPVLGNVIKMAALVDATRTLSILSSSGVSLLETLNIVVETSANLVYKLAFAKIKKQVEKGVTLGAAMKQTEIFPPILVQMTMIGEQTGHMDETLLRVSRYFESDSAIAIKAMTTLIEPLILVILGIGVSFLVFAIITPIYSLTATLK